MNKACFNLTLPLLLSAVIKCVSDFNVLVSPGRLVTIGTFDLTPSDGGPRSAGWRDHSAPGESRRRKFDFDFRDSDGRGGGGGVAALTSFLRFFRAFCCLASSLSWSPLMRRASSLSRVVCSCSSRSMVCFCCRSRFSTSWSYCRFLLWRGGRGQGSEGSLDWARLRWMLGARYKYQYEGARD